MFFEEIPVAPELLDAHSLVEPSLLDDDKQDRLDEVIEQLRDLLSVRLTARQRQIVHLYFFEGLSQTDIAATLGISQQAVSRQLFGVIRAGRKIGGAIARLRKACEERGIDPSQWV